MSSQRVQSVRNGLRKFNRWAGVLSSDPYGLGLSLSQSGALVDLERFGQLRPAEIATSLKLDRSSVSRLLSVLLKKGLISILESPDDGRSKTITLTKKGQKSVDEIHRLSNESVLKAFQFLSAKDQDAIASAFDKLISAVEQAELKKIGLEESP